MQNMHQPAASPFRSRLSRRQPCQSRWARRRTIAFIAFRCSASPKAENQQQQCSTRASPPPPQVASSSTTTTTRAMAASAVQSALDRVRLYSTLMARAASLASTLLLRRVTGQTHPFGWTVSQQWGVTMMRVLFEVGKLVHWRNFTALMARTARTKVLEQGQLVLERAPRFTTPGSRPTWWVRLKPELYPSNPKARLVLLFLHGGAFVAGTPTMYLAAFQNWMRQLAKQDVQLEVLAVGYPLAPEHPFPAGLLGVEEVYRWLVAQQGGRGDNIIIAGDSAGGNLTLASLAHMRDGGDPASWLLSPPAPRTAQPPLVRPLAAIMISPAVDLSGSSVFLRGRRGGKDPFAWDYVVASEGIDISHLYLAAPGGPSPQLANPLVSPTLLQDFGGLVQQQLLVVSGGVEAMVSDIRAFAEKAAKAAPAASSGSSGSSSDKQRAEPLRVVYHEEHGEPHCYAVLAMPGLLAKGSRVLVPFIAAMAEHAAQE